MKFKIVVLPITVLVLLSFLLLYFFMPPGLVALKGSNFQYEAIDENGQGRVAIGDIDGDGDNDVAVHTWNRDIVWYEYPRWSRHVIATDIDNGGDAIDLADLDNDGDLDLVGPAYVKTNIYWFENPTTSAPKNARLWPVHMIGEAEKEIKDLEAIDLDRDGATDVISRHHDVVRLSFQISPNRWISREIPIFEREGMAVGDLDGDGDKDIVLNGFWLEHPNNPRNGEWNRHNIDPLWYEMSGGGWRDNGVKIALSDIDGDDHLDVVFSASERNENDWPIAWYSTSNPKGGKHAWKKHVIGRLPNVHTLQVADFDLDGDPDVLACRLRDSFFLPALVYLNNGEAEHWPRELIHEGGCYSGKVGDIDTDGDTDFVSSRTWIQPPIYLLRNKRNPDRPLKNYSFRKHHIDDLSEKAMFIQSGDVDGDGKYDIVAGRHWWRNPGKLDGKWIRSEIGEPLHNAFAVFDFDSDGDVDILGTQGRGASPNNAFAWARNDGRGTFSVLTNIDTLGAGDFIQGRVIADFGLGVQVAVSWHNGAGGIYALTVPSDPSSETWTIERLSAETQSEDLSAGDIDRDGDLDLLLGSVWLRNDLSSWTAFVLGEPIEGVPDRNSLADIDGDGDLDAVISLENGIDVYWFEAPSDPTGNWERHLIGKIPGQGFSMDVADFDLDGDLDIVVGEHRGEKQNRVIVFINERQGASWRYWIADSGYANVIDHHDGTQAIDIDQDGDLDLTSIGWYNPRLWIFENVQ